MTAGFITFEWPVLVATGADAATWLNGIVTCEVTAVSSTKAQWGLLLTKQGKIQAELLFVRHGDTLLVAVMGGDAQQTLASLEHYLVMEDAEVAPAEGLCWAIVLGGGPEARAAVGQALPAATMVPLPMAPDAGLLLCSSGSAETLSVQLGRLLPALTPAQWRHARVDLGIPEYGTDFDAKDNPHEASIERRAINWQKGCYLGQEVVFMQEARGKVKRRLARVVPEEPWDPPAPAAEVLGEGGQQVGEVTTVATGVVLARLKAPAYEVGTRLYIDGRPVRVEALGRS